MIQASGIIFMLFSVLSNGGDIGKGRLCLVPSPLSIHIVIPAVYVCAYIQAKSLQRTRKLFYPNAAKSKKKSKSEEFKLNGTAWSVRRASL
jgi:hypothetical protein